MSKYTDREIEDVVKEGKSFNDAHKLLTGGSSGSSYVWFRNRVVKLGLDTSHFNPHWNASNAARISNRKRAADWLTHDESLKQRVKRTALEQGLSDSGVAKRCSICSLIDWQGAPLKLHIDHRDGNWRNNTVENLRYLCPNCHTQTETYGYTGK